jgi:hypothetical protein
MTEPTIDTVFDTLDEWRCLPSYQLERRADIYFAMFLTDVLEKRFGTKLERLVIPEFPLRHGTLGTQTGRTGPNRSVKVDYVAFAKDYKRVFFVELKTSMKSRNSKQDSYLKRAAGLEFKALFEGVRLLKEHSDERKKYDCLLDMLSGGPENAAETRPEIVYVQPTRDVKNHQADATCITFEDFAAVVEGRGSIGNRFAQSLRCWTEVKV